MMNGFLASHGGVFQQKVKEIILDPRKIQERLRVRDGKNYSAEMLQALQDAELAHANDVCSAIGTALRAVQPDMLSEAIEFVAQQLAARDL
jgi:hypothetical protein